MNILQSLGEMPELQVLCLATEQVQSEYNTFKIFSQQTSHTDFERTMLKINVCSFCIPIQQ